MKNRDLKEFEKKLLDLGNRYTFGGLLREFYLEEAEANGFDLKTYVNAYQSYIEFNEKDKTYTFIGDKGKYYFDTAMNCTGFKAW